MMDELLKSSELARRVRKISENFIENLKNNPMQVEKIFDNFLSEFFELTGIETIMGEFTAEQRKEIGDFLGKNLPTLETLFLVIPPKKIDNNFSSKIDELFKMCKTKNSKRLKKIFQEPRIELFRKLVSTWKRSWRYVAQLDLPREARMDSKFMAAKSLSEGMYRQLLIVIQQMMQIDFGYKPVKKFGVIINQLDNSPMGMDVFVNKTAYNIRNAESHENIEFEKGNTIRLFDEENHIIQNLREEDLDKTIKWLTDFTKSIVFSLQKNYLELLEINSGNRIDYLLNIFEEKIGFFCKNSQVLAGQQAKG